MNFKEGRWNHEINVTDFVKTNITPYEATPHFWLVLRTYKGCMEQVSGSFG